MCVSTWHESLEGQDHTPPSPWYPQMFAVLGMSWWSWINVYRTNLLHELKLEKGGHYDQLGHEQGHPLSGTIFNYSFISKAVHAHNEKSKQKNIQNIHVHILPNLGDTLDSFQLMSEHNCVCVCVSVRVCVRMFMYTVFTSMAVWNILFHCLMILSLTHLPLLGINAVSKFLLFLRAVVNILITKPYPHILHWFLRINSQKQTFWVMGNLHCYQQW